MKNNFGSGKCVVSDLCGQFPEMKEMSVKCCDSYSPFFDNCSGHCSNDKKFSENYCPGRPCSECAEFKAYKELPTEILECPYCGERFDIEDDLVYCPYCSDYARENELEKEQYELVVKYLWF